MNLLVKAAFVIATTTALTAFAVDSTGSAPVAVTDTTAKAAVVDSSMSTEKVFTFEELASFNGKDGKTIYVAVDGVVYDVSKIAEWKSGVHHGIKAGTDGSKKIQSSPHGKKILKKLPVVGKLAQK
ncbi:MAG TPA: cytochrome b5 domain-containing protein [Chitinispirillaceae bacterium]|nr:cytochrome b5 domain-containing protein [Chitinispirillaceae bacterium]